MSFEFLEPAKDELDEAVGFYSRQRTGLGEEFRAEVKRTILRILNSPEQWRRIFDDVRQCRTKRFPYAILYEVTPTGILIVAVMHTKRHPDYWKGRI